MDRFNIETNPAIMHIMLYEQAVGAGVSPQAYLCCTSGLQGTWLVCLHLPSKFMSLLDGRATPWDGQDFAFLGEVTQSIVMTVFLLNTTYCAVMNTRVKRSDYIVTGGFRWSRP
jgi:hypothetical protein